MVHRPISCVSLRIPPSIQGGRQLPVVPERKTKKTSAPKRNFTKKKNMSYTYTFHQRWFFQKFSGLFEFFVFHPPNSKLHKVTATPTDPVALWWRWHLIDIQIQLEDRCQIRRIHLITTGSKHVCWTWAGRYCRFFVNRGFLFCWHKCLVDMGFCIWDPASENTWGQWSMFNWQGLAGCNEWLSHLCDVCVCTKFFAFAQIFLICIYIYIYIYTKHIQTLLWVRRECYNIPKHSLVPFSSVNIDPPGSPFPNVKPTCHPKRPLLGEHPRRLTAGTCPHGGWEDDFPFQMGDGYRFLPLIFQGVLMWPAFFSTKKILEMISISCTWKNHLSSIPFTHHFFVTSTRPSKNHKKK